MITRNKNITEKDIYYFYPYKKNPVTNGKTIPQPYVKKTDISDHAYTLTYDEWLAIIKDYILEVRSHIMLGKVFKIPKQLGTWQLRKYKINTKVDWNATRQLKKKTYYKKEDIDFNLIVKWYRTPKNSSFQFKNHWKLRLAKGFRMELAKEIRKDYNYIYNIIDT